MVRTFVAIDLTEEIRESARQSLEILREAPGRLTIVEPENLHLTLKFLGEVDQAAIGGIVMALRATNAEPFEITVGYAVCNHPRRPRVIWCDVTDSGESAALARQVDDLLEPLGFPREKRPFRPHVTLARVKDLHPALTKEVERRIPREPLGRCLVSAVKLKKSTLTPGGSIYDDLAEVTL